MKYRGLTYNREKESYEWVYGLPSYGYATDEVAEIGTVYGDFKEIFPDTLGEQTPYRDKNGKEIYTGDIVALEVDGQIREGEYLILKHPQNCLMKSYRNWHRKE